MPTFGGSFALSGGALNLSAGQTLTLASNTSFAGGTVTRDTLALNGNTTVNGSTLIQAPVADNGTITVNAGALDLGGRRYRQRADHDQPRHWPRTGPNERIDP